MNADCITEEEIVYFFNKYKYNSDQIFHLERRILNESYDFAKWQEMLAANSKLTRAHFSENEYLLDEFVRPAIKNPELLSPEAIHSFLLHITFYLFENNIDSHITDDLVNAILEKCPDIPPVDRFEALINLGISKTVTMYGPYEEAIKYFEEASEIFPDFSAAPNHDTRIHLVFCKVFQLLCMCLYKVPDYKKFVKIIKDTEKMLKGGNTALYKKMWGDHSDFPFHISLLFRYFRIYGIFLAGQCNFELKDDDEENKKALEEIITWTTCEYATEFTEGKINPMVYTFFQKHNYLENKISKEEYFEALYTQFTNLSNSPLFIYPEPAFPIDDDPVDPLFANMLDKMKIFNWSFSYAYILIPELFKISDSKEVHKKLTENLVKYYECSVYAEKGFQTDMFVFDNIRTVAETIENESDFISFVQTIFVHREITSAIHFSMVSNLAGICLSHFIESNPELFVTENYKTSEEVRDNRTKLLEFIKYAGYLHDIGKIGRTNLVNLHFRKITDSEYQRLSEHTNLGSELIANIPYLEKYRDIILGHHKFYDGSEGYPKNVDMSSSQYKIFIDLISICDTIDTSTDYRGRNYSRKKTFDDILVELKEMNTRYSPELVKIIDEDEALKDELRYLTSTGRNYTSYETYLRFIQPNTNFSEDDIKEAIELVNPDKNSLKSFFKKVFPSNSDSEISTHIDDILDGENTTLFAIQNKKNEIFALLSGRKIYNLTKNFYEFSISEIIVRPEYRRKGWGTELLKFTTENLKTKNISVIKINIPSDYSTESFFWIEGFTKKKHCTMEKDI
ncbi:MAG: GNAT family N-acetyltransferase [Treponema sp.]|nr:GNAT family N-acetyltransferase [Treponema sp.]